MAIPARKPQLCAVPADPVERIRVCGIIFRCDEGHTSRCVRAIRYREHPKWSSWFSDFRVAVKLRGVR